MAVGATPGDIACLFGGRDGAMVSARYASPLPYGVSPYEAAVYLAAVGVALLVALLAVGRPPGEPCG